MITDLTVDQWRHAGSDRPFTFRHTLCGHRLLTLDGLADLADRMDPAQIETTGADAATVVDRRVTSRLSAPAGDLVRQTETDRRWFALRHVEADPIYRSLVEDLFTQFRRCAGPDAAGARNPEGYVFVGAAGAVTPAHVDHEHNLFFQVAGTKRFSTGGFPDAASAQRTFEAMYGGEYGSTGFGPTDPTVHVLGPGDGLYVPPSAVHLVENTDELAISFSLVFHDDELDRSGRVFACNYHLRQLGLRPLAPGRSPWRDGTKSAVVTTWRWTRRMLDRTGPA